MIDVLMIMPMDNLVGQIQAPELQNTKIASITQNTENGLDRIPIGTIEKEIIIKQVCLNDIQDYMSYIALRNKGELIFEGYDGLTFGLFSKNFKIPVWFITKYRDSGIYDVSDLW